MFRYTIDFPLNNVPASKILRNLGVKKFKYVGFGYSKKYISLEHDYELSFDHDMGFLKFNIDLKDKIGAIMDQITDIVGAQRGEYTIMDNETDEEVCLDDLNTSISSERSCFRYSVRLYSNTAKSFQQAIMIAHHNIVLTDDDEEYECEQFLIDIDGNESVGFYFNQTKLDINYINSIIYPVMKALNYKKFDYVVDDYVTGEEIECEADLVQEQDDESSYCSSFEFHEAAAAAAQKQYASKADDKDNKSNCSSYEFGQPTTEETEEWLDELVAEQDEYIDNVYNNIRETNYARLANKPTKSYKYDDGSSSDEWLPPAEEKNKKRATKLANNTIAISQKSQQMAKKENKKNNKKELIKSNTVNKVKNFYEVSIIVYDDKYSPDDAVKQIEKSFSIELDGEADRPWIYKGKQFSILVDLFNGIYLTFHKKELDVEYITNIVKLVYEAIKSKYNSLNDYTGKFTIHNLLDQSDIECDASFAKYEDDEDDDESIY